MLGLPPELEPESWAELIITEDPPYHWIEEGTDEDFRRNILESNLPFLAFGVTGSVAPLFQASGTHYGDFGEILYRNPGMNAVQGEVHLVDAGQVEGDLLQMLLKRPEMSHPAFVSQ